MRKQELDGYRCGDRRSGCDLEMLFEDGLFFEEHVVRDRTVTSFRKELKGVEEHGIWFGGPVGSLTGH